MFIISLFYTSQTFKFLKQVSQELSIKRQNEKKKMVSVKVSLHSHSNSSIRISNENDKKRGELSQSPPRKGSPILSSGYAQS